MLSHRIFTVQWWGGGGDLQEARPSRAAPQAEGGQGPGSLLALTSKTQPSVETLGIQEACSIGGGGAFSGAYGLAHSQSLGLRVRASPSRPTFLHLRLWAWPPLGMERLRRSGQSKDQNHGHQEEQKRKTVACPGWGRPDTRLRVSLHTQALPAGCWSRAPWDWLGHQQHTGP